MLLHCFIFAMTLLIAHSSYYKELKSQLTYEVLRTTLKSSRSILQAIRLYELFLH
jgi:hypothetical protein